MQHVGMLPAEAPNDAHPGLPPDGLLLSRSRYVTYPNIFETERRCIWHCVMGTACIRISPSVPTILTLLHAGEVTLRIPIFFCQVL